MKTENDEGMTILFEPEGASGSFIESLAKSKVYLSKIYRFDCSIMTKLDEAIEAELELAILETNKAKSGILKDTTKKNVTPLKGA